MIEAMKDLFSQYFYRRNLPKIPNKQKNRQGRDQQG